MNFKPNQIILAVLFLVPLAALCAAEASKLAGSLINDVERMM